MKTLSQLPSVTYALLFAFSDPHHQQTNCELVVHPDQGWAVATELPEAPGAGLMQSLTTLASQICTKYGIQPQRLSLFARYAYPEDAIGWYVVRFDHSDPDLFAGVRFLVPSRKELKPDVAGLLLEQLARGQALAPEWRAIGPHTTS